MIYYPYRKKKENRKKEGGEEEATNAAIFTVLESIINEQNNESLSDDMADGEPATMDMNVTVEDEIDPVELHDSDNNPQDNNTEFLGITRSMQKVFRKFGLKWIKVKPAQSEDNSMPDNSECVQLNEKNNDDNNGTSTTFHQTDDDNQTIGNATEDNFDNKETFNTDGLKVPQIHKLKPQKDKHVKERSLFDTVDDQTDN